MTSDSGLFALSSSTSLSLTTSSLSYSGSINFFTIPFELLHEFHPVLHVQDHVFQDM